MTDDGGIDRDGYSPREDYQALGMTQGDLARVSSVDPRTARRWCTDRPEDTPRAVRVMLRLMRKHSESPEDWMPSADHASVPIHAPARGGKPSE